MVLNLLAYKSRNCKPQKQCYIQMAQTVTRVTETEELWGLSILWQKIKRLLLIMLCYFSHLSTLEVTRDDRYQYNKPPAVQCASFILFVMTIKCDGAQHLWCFIHSGHQRQAYLIHSQLDLFLNSRRHKRSDVDNANQLHNWVERVRLFTTWSITSDTSSQHESKINLIYSLKETVL